MFFKKIMFYGENQFLGVKEFFEKKKNYFFSGKVVSKKAKLFFISKKDLEKCFFDFPEFEIFFKKQTTKIFQNLNKQLNNIKKYKLKKKSKFPKLILKKNFSKEKNFKISKKFQIRSVDWKNRLKLSKKRINIIKKNNLFNNLSIYANKKVQKKTHAFLSINFPHMKKYRNFDNKKKIKNNNRNFVEKFKKVIYNKNNGFESCRDFKKNDFFSIEKKNLSPKFFSPRYKLFN